MYIDLITLIKFSFCRNNDFFSQKLLLIKKYILHIVYMLFIAIVFIVISVAAISWFTLFFIKRGVLMKNDTNNNQKFCGVQECLDACWGEHEKKNTDFIASSDKGEIINYIIKQGIKKESDLLDLVHSTIKAFDVPETTPSF